MGILKRAHPVPDGDYKTLGSFQVRLPPPPGQEKKNCVQAMVTYPADASGKFEGIDLNPYLRLECMEGLQAMEDNTGPPVGAMKFAVGGYTQVDHPYLPLKPPSGKKWPIVVFSHGLYGCMEMYNHYCRQLASFGTICVTLEHEDGTALHAINCETGERMHFVDEPGGGVDANGTLEDFTKREVGFRTPFLAQRNKEVAACTKGLRALARGQVAVTTDPVQKALQQVMRNADPDKFVLASHSFGSAAAVHFFHDPVTEGLPFVGAIIADLWWQPDANEMNKELPVPFVQLLSEEWVSGTDVRKGSDGAKRLHLANIKDHNSLGVYWAKGTKHLWISDMSYWFPVFLLRKMGRVTHDPDATMTQTCQVVKAALAAFLPEDGDTSTPKQRFEQVLYEVKVKDASCQGCGSAPPSNIVEKLDVK